MVVNLSRWVRRLCTFAVAHKERNTNPDHDIKDIPTSLFTCIAAKVYMINTGELFCDAFTKAVKGITNDRRMMRRILIIIQTDRIEMVVILPILIRMTEAFIE